MPCACVSPCEVPSLAPARVHSTAIEFNSIHVYGAAEIEGGEVLVFASVLVFYAAAVLLLLPFVWHFQRRASWCLLNLTGLRAVATKPRKSRPFRLVLSERERRAVRRGAEVTRGVFAASLPGRLVHSLVPARTSNART